GERHYREAFDLITHQPQKLGLMSGWSWYDDPKRLGFLLARYKFVAKMLAGQDHVLEVGCGDGFGTRVVAQTVGRITAVDFDAELINSAKEIMSDRWPFECYVHDMMQGPVPGEFAAVYSLDVLEHILPDQESKFLNHLTASLLPQGVAIIGMPSLQSQSHASAHSRIGHVNCKDQGDFKQVMLKWFHQVFMFSMNDEVVHTGFHPMSHYNLCVCCGKK
ncbi:MAG: methyltransferase domain-containing protein, partial [Nitrospira sp.]|nr:methyltransferase domain-containing protein [Nitrospira sp.]